MSTETELAWCAGFLDGEGNFAFKKVRATACALRVQAAQCDPAVLERLKAVLGGKVYGPYRPKTINSRPYWQWCIGRSMDALWAMETLLPYVSPIKRAQIQESIAKYRAAAPSVPCKKLTETDVLHIQDLLTADVTQRWIAKQYGVHYVTINDIALKRTWKKAG